LFAILPAKAATASSAS